MDVSNGRVRSLDGLRGLAALIVVFHHSLLASAPKLANAFIARGYEAQSKYLTVPKGLIPPRGSLNWLLTYTPLHIFWAGSEAVVVFFVLSGFVLTLPVARGKGLKVSRYYPTRLLRLYLPVWGALVVAAILHVLISHEAIKGATWWLNDHSEHLNLHALKIDASLTTNGGDSAFTGVLWSLRWEVLFSLLLPGLLLMPLKARMVRFALVLLCFVSLLYGESKATLELPPFLLGMVMAFEIKNIERLRLRLGKRTPSNSLFKCCLILALVCLLTADWWMGESRSASTLVAVGACLAVLGALTVGSFRTLLTARPMQWTGKRAFSLYLVHEPLLVALAFAFGGHMAPLPFVLIATLTALLATGIFFRFVEAPSHRFARSMGSRCSKATKPLSSYILETWPIQS